MQAGALSTLGRAGLLVLALTAIVRLVGIDHGMPFWLVNDELPLVGGTLRMIELKNLVPSLEPRLTILYYPPGLPYLYLSLFIPVLAVWWIAAGFPDTASFADVVLSDLRPLWLVARLSSVAFAVATAWVIMRMTAEVTRDRRIALLAGLVYAVCLHHALLAHFARIWPATILFYWWGIWASWRVYADGSRRAYFWAALAAGLGFAVNYIGVLVAASTGVAHLCRHRRVRIDREILIFTGIVATFIVIFTALYWQNLVRLMGMSAIFGSVPGSMAPVAGLPASHAPLDIARTAAAFFGAFWDTAPVIFLVGAFGLPLLAWRYPAFTVIAGTTLVLHLTVVIFGYVPDDRYILPVTILFMISASLLVVTLSAGSRVRLMLGSAALVALSVVGVVQLDRLLSRPNTRVIAREWLLARVTDGEGVVNIMRSVPFEQTIDSIRDQASIVDETSLTYLQRRRLAGHAVASGGGGREIRAVDLLQPNEETFAGRSMEAMLDRLRAADYRWVVTEHVFGPQGRFGLMDVVRRHAHLVHRIEPGPDNLLGPDLNRQNQWGSADIWSMLQVYHLGSRIEIWRID
jgi:hypothetical protein